MELSLVVGDIRASSSAVLAPAGVWTSDVFAVHDAGSLVVSLYSDVDGQLVIRQRSDGVNWDAQSTITYLAGSTPVIEVDVVGTQAQLVYTNGSVQQAVFRISVRPKRTATGSGVQSSGSSAGLSVFGTEQVSATVVNGQTWKDLLDKSSLVYQTDVLGFTVTRGGSWAGLVKIRIVDGAGSKIFPGSAELVEGTDFFDATEMRFIGPVTVPVVNGYKLQFRSSSVADGAGETLALTELVKSERQ